jgi:dihydrofolate synthase/folylpolyglutamate synthase
MNYAEALDFLAALGLEMWRAKLGLDAIATLLKALGEPQQKYPTAIVAGTNGKGSTSAILASILQKAGYRTGLYTSPHLIRVNERIRVDDREISDEDFARRLTEVREVAERLFAHRQLEHLPSFFEYLTAVAFWHFARAGVNFAVLEVGMGGRLDATNVTQPRVALITPVDIDHAEYLGTTRAAIAAEKAGVIKPGQTVVSACENPEAAAVIRRRCQECDANLFETFRFAQLSNLRHVEGQYSFDISLNGDCLTGLTSPLRGRFQVTNAVTALTAAYQLAQQGFHISREAMMEGLRTASWPGRLEVRESEPYVLPWKAPANAMMRCRLVWKRASFIAASIASVPELPRNDRFGLGPGTISLSFSAIWPTSRTTSILAIWPDVSARPDRENSLNPAAE